MTAQEREPLDPAKVMAEHTERNGECDACREACLYCEADHVWPCEPYRLAKALAADQMALDRAAARVMSLATENAALREKVQRVEALCEHWDGIATGLDRAAKANIGQEWDAQQQAGNLRGRSSSVRAALAGDR